jgi:AraC-like DNA-binding protein
MDYDKFASDLRSSNAVSFSSAEENEEFMRRLGVTQQVRQLGKGAFHAHFAMINTDQTVLVADRFSQACSVYLEPADSTVGLLMFSSAAGELLVSGKDAGNDKLVILRGEYGADLVTPQLAGSQGIVLPEARFSEMTQALCPSCSIPETTAVLKGDTGELQTMRDAVIQTMAGNRPSDEDVANLAEQLVLWAGFSSTDERPERFCSRLLKVRIAKQVQAYIEGHYHEDILIQDLCRATGKGARTLQRCFNEYFDMTITGYLKMVRLNAAHRALSSARPDEKTVASIALSTGFAHLGRFSVEYKNHFGKSARETLSQTSQ